MSMKGGYNLKNDLGSLGRHLELGWLGLDRFQVALDPAALNP